MEAMTKNDLTDSDKARIADLATSYVLGGSMAQAEFELDAEELDDILLDLNVEKCPNCGWYDDCFNLLAPGKDEPDGNCSNCRINPL